MYTGCPDTVVKDVKTFFEDKKFDTDIVDLITQATGDALGIKVNIYRKSPAGNKENWNGCCSGKSTWCSSVQIITPTILHMQEQNTELITRKWIYTRCTNTKGAGWRTTWNDRSNTASNSSSSPKKEMLDQVIFISSCAPNEVHINLEVVEKFLRPRTIFPVQLFEKAVPLKKSTSYLGQSMGITAYTVMCTSRNYNKKTAGRRWFYMRTTIKSEFRGIRKVGTCLGSYEYVNKEMLIFVCRR